MAEADTIEEGVLEQLVQKLTPCIERGELDACVEEATRLADEIGIDAGALLSLAGKLGKKGEYELAYVLALGAVDGLNGYNNAAAYSNAGLAAQSLGNVGKAEAHYLMAIEADPKIATAHYNYANLLTEFGKKDEAAIHYLNAIERDSNDAAAHSNYANLLTEFGKKDDAVIHYLKAIEIDSNDAAAHYNYAILLTDINKKDEAIIHYLKAIEINPNYAAAHSNYAILLTDINKKDEAIIHYLKAIEIDPNYAAAHGAYGLLLIDWDKRDDALSEIESASELFKGTGRITFSYLVKAWFYQRYSEKYFSRKEYLKSSVDADKASDEYFKAAETVEGDLIDNLKLQGNVLKAKSFVRKIPKKPWYNKIYKKLGTKSDIPELVRNLQNAAIWYQKASACPVDGKNDVCGACHLSISVFSEVLGAMSAFISGKNAEITKDKWLNSLEAARETYVDKKLEAGTVLVDLLKQLVMCVDKLAEQRASGLNLHEERFGKCYTNLTKINENLGGVLGLISDHATEAIRDYAKKECMVGFVYEVNPKKSILDNRLVKAACWVFGTIITGIIIGLFFERRIQDIVFAWMYNM